MISIKNEQGNRELEMKMSNDLTWTEVIENVLDFLRGSGYVIPYGDFQIIEEEQKELSSNSCASGAIEIKDYVPKYCFNCSCGKKEAALGEENT